jgi:hypothetical protein
MVRRPLVPERILMRGAPIEPRVDSLALVVEALVDALALVVEALIDPVAGRGPGLRGGGGERQAGGEERGPECELLHDFVLLVPGFRPVATLEPRPRAEVARTSPAAR